MWLLSMAGSMGSCMCFTALAGLSSAKLPCKARGTFGIKRAVKLLRVFGNTTCGNVSPAHSQASRHFYQETTVTALEISAQDKVHLVVWKGRQKFLFGLYSELTLRPFFVFFFYKVGGIVPLEGE